MYITNGNRLDDCFLSYNGAANAFEIYGSKLLHIFWMDFLSVESEFAFIYSISSEQMIIRFGRDEFS